MAGFLCGMLCFGGGAAYAAGVMAEHTPQLVYVDGRAVSMDAYNVANTNYMKLRDIGEAVGFNVCWDGTCVRI